MGVLYSGDRVDCKVSWVQIQALHWLGLPLVGNGFVFPNFIFPAKNKWCIKKKCYPHYLTIFNCLFIMGILLNMIWSDCVHTDEYIYEEEKMKSTVSTYKNHCA